MSSTFQNTATASSISDEQIAPHLSLAVDNTRASDAPQDSEPVASLGTDHTPEPSGGVDRADVPSLNNADLLGMSTDAMQALLNQPATLLTGALWGTRDTRNTQDGDWTPVSMPWLAWIMGGKATGKGSADWGFSNHPVGKDKEGQSIVLGSSIGQARKAKAMEYMYAMGLDIDSGASLDDVLVKLEKLGLFCIVYTSFNHGKRGLQLKRDDVLRKLKITSDPSLLQIQQYLREFDKSRYEEDFIARCTIRSAKKQVKDGVVIELDTPPLDKFRLILPLDKPVKLIDLAETQEAALEVWEDKITGLAREVLGVHFDSSCTDPSRLFYTGRHPKDAADWYCAVVQGDPLRFEDVPTYKKSRYTAKRENINPFEMAGEDLTEGKAPMTLTPSGRSLNEWHTTFKSRFLVANLLEDYCGDRLVRDGTPPQGSVFLHCPFETEHTSEGGTGTMATNCIDSSSEYWTVHCKHDACQGRHKTQFLEEMLRQGWFEEDVIYDLDGGYLLGPEDCEEEDDDAEVTEPDAPTDGAKAKPSKVSAATLKKRFGKMIREEASFTKKADAIRDAAEESGFTKSELGKIWAEAEAGQQKVDAAAEAEKRQQSVSPDYVPLDQATGSTVKAAAEAAKWLPHFVRYHHGWFEAQAMDSAESKWKRLCRAFEVPFIAFGETTDGRQTEITIRYEHRSKQRGIVESVYKIGDTFVESGAFLGRLANAGLEIDGMADSGTLVRLFKSVNTSSEAVLVEKAGWHGDAYVSPTGETVNAGLQRFVLNPVLRVNDARQGTLADHCGYATTALTGLNSRYFLPGYLSGFVGCLVDYIGNESSIIVANEGPSTRAKTSGAKAGAAHWTIPNGTGLFHKADTTATAAEVLAVKGNGAVLVLDDDGAARIPPEEKQRLLLQWGDGSGRNRGAADGGTRATKTWRTCFVTSTEVGFINSMAAADVDIKTGAVSRVFSVDFDGAVTLPADSAELAAIRALANYEDSGVYGVTGPLFAETLAGLGRDKVKARVSEVEAEWASLAQGAGARVVRAAAIFTVAGEIAQEAGIFASEVPVREMMRGLLIDTLDARTSHLNTEQQALNTLRRSILRGLQMGTIVSSDEDREINRSEVLGYFTQGEKTLGPLTSEVAMRARTYVLPVDRLGKLGNTTAPKSLADRLDKEGALIRRKKGGGSTWCHDHVPGEGGGFQNIRVTGLFVHGQEEKVAA